MKRDYAGSIRESASELAELERTLRGTGPGDRVKMLRLLKTNAFSSRNALARLLGYSERQVQRWWATYEEEGLSALLEVERGSGRPERMSAEAVAALKDAVRAGDVALLKEARGFLEERFGISYGSLQGVADMMRRHEIPLRG